MLQAHKISFKYPQSGFLFKEISLKINLGEVVGLYGKSGSGKTTLAKLLSGYIPVQEGKITLFEKSYPLNTKKSHPVQLIWQHADKAINPKWKMKKVLAEAGVNPEICQQFGIKKEWLSRYSGELSGGELQRFCLARVFNSETKFLIADEMTTMLDALTQAQIWNTLLPMAKKRNLGMLVISHQQDLLKKVSDRIIDFDDLIDNKK